MQSVLVLAVVGSLNSFSGEGSSLTNLISYEILPFWAFECVGSGYPVVNGNVQKYDAATGDIVWLVTDSDGMKGTLSAVIDGNKIAMFEVSGQFNFDRSTFSIITSDCPGGFVGNGFK